MRDETGELGAAETERRRRARQRLATARHVSDHRRRKRLGVLLTQRRVRVSVDLLKMLIEARFLERLDPVSVEAAIDRALRDWMALRLAKAR